MPSKLLILKGVLLIKYALVMPEPVDPSRIFLAATMGSLIAYPPVSEYHGRVS
jgi:hypothetical protein